MPIDFFAKEIVVNAIDKWMEHLINILSNRSKLSHSRKMKIVTAIKALMLAISHTRAFIKATGYVSNTSLEEEWLIALEKCEDAKISEIAEYLYNKAKFWGQPEDWLNYDSSLELIPKLDELQSRCDEIFSMIARH